MACLNGLENEVLALVFEYLADTSPNSALNLSLINSHFYAVGQLVVHRYKLVVTDDEDFKPDLKTLIQNPKVLRGLRHIEIQYQQLKPFDSSSEGEGDIADPWEELANFIKKLANLTTLTWCYNGGFPLNVLDALHEYHRSAELRVFRFGRCNRWAGPTDPAEIALAHSPALTTIKARVMSYGQRHNANLACVGRILANAPNLKMASISLSRIRHRYRDDDSQTFLEQQKRMVEQFYTHDRPNSSVARLTLDGFGTSEEVLKEWGQFVDLSRLEDFKCSRGLPSISYFHSAPQLLKNIKHLSLNLQFGERIESFPAAAENYLTACPPLETISLWSWKSVVSLDTILTRHGPTLNTLQLHEREYPGDVNFPYIRQLLCAEDIKAIREACPKLRDLSIDCDRHTQELKTETEVDSVLTELAAMKLSRLQIYYDLGLPYLAAVLACHTQLPQTADSGEARAVSMLAPSTEQHIRPFLTSLWKFVFGSRTSASHRCLRVKFGEWERKAGGRYILPDDDWLAHEQRLRSFWTATPHERDDQKGSCVVRNAGTALEARPEPRYPVR